MILQKPKGKGEWTDWRKNVPGQKAASAKANRRFGMFTGQEAPVVAAWQREGEHGQIKDRRDFCMGFLDPTATSLR